MWIRNISVYSPLPTRGYLFTLRAGYYNKNLKKITGVKKILVTQYINFAINIWEDT